MFNYSKETEFLSLPGLTQLQTRKMREHLAYCKAHSPFYKDKLKDIDPETFTLDNIGALPFTTKDDIVENQDTFLACSEKDFRDIVFTSGTTGEPCRFIYTQNDLERNAYNEERCFCTAGVNAEDRILLTCTLDRCFIAGMAYYMGGMKTGASVLRNGLSSIESHLWIIRKVRPTVIVGIASFLVKLAELAQRENVSLDHIRCLICVGEPIKDEKFVLNGIGSRLQQFYPHAELFATYASTEITTGFSECSCHCGGHQPADLAYLEIIDENGNTVPPRQPGEVVVTPFGITGMPLIRFRTGDISFMLSEPCRCGRNTPRLGPILGRKKHLLKYKGTSIYPQVIFNTLTAIPGIDNYYVVAYGEDLSDSIEVVISTTDPALTPESVQRQLSVTCRARIPVVIRDTAEVAAMVFGSSRKPQHFFDKRGE